MRRNRTTDMAQDVWAYLPDRFVLVYSDLCSRALSAPGATKTDAVRVSGGDGSNGPLRDTQALEQKRKIDRVLRRLALEHVTGESAPRAKCIGCGKFVENDWTFCANCGIPMNRDLTIHNNPWKGLPLR